ncbi:hypothetical protein BH20ACT13_BH20ACT13_05380 [soil metagenome]
MNEITEFGAAVLAVSAAVFVALLGMPLADRLAVPYAAIFLVGAVVLSESYRPRNSSSRRRRSNESRSSP